MSEKKEKRPDRHAGFRDARGRLLPGNPGGPGRKKATKSFNEALRKRLAMPLSEAHLTKLCQTFDIDGEDLQRLAQAENRMDAMAELIISRALDGNMETFKEVFDRVSPKKAALQVTGTGDGPIRVVTKGGSLSEREAADAYWAAVSDPLGDEEDAGDLGDLD